MAFSINNTFDQFTPVAASQVGQGTSPMSKPEPLASYQLKNIKDVKKEEKSKFKTGAMILGVSTIALLLGRGVSSKYNTQIKQYLTLLKEKMLTKDIKRQSKGMLQGTITMAQKGFINVLGFLDASSNINAFKDTMFTKLLRSNKYSSKCMDFVNQLFKKTAISSTDKAYKAFGGTHEDFISQATRILGKDAPEIGELRKLYEAGFSKTARDSRIDFVMDSVKNLYENVSKKLYKDGVWGLFKNWKNYKTYITTDLVKKEKLQLQNEVMTMRRAYSNNPMHQANDIKQVLRQIRVEMPVNQMKIDNLKVISRLEELATRYKTATGKDKEQVIDAIKTELQKLKEFVPKDNIKQIETALQDEKGVIQKLTEQVEQKFKNNPNSPELKEFRRLTNELSAKLDKAVNLEHSSLFDKLAEIEVGSAPTDVLSLTVPIGLAGYQIAKSEDKDEKVGNALKTGIPIVGAIGTALYGTVRMFSGVKNIMLGLISGWGLSVVGNIANDKYIAKAQDKAYINEQLKAIGVDPKHPIIVKKAEA